jgi:hypothetical protein
VIALSSAVAIDTAQVDDFASLIQVYFPVNGLIPTLCEKIINVDNQFLFSSSKQ